MRGGGCFAPHATLQALSEDGSTCTRRACDVRAGDRIAIAGGGYSRVACVVLSPIDSGRATLRRVDGLMLTEWHPVHLRGAWHFPAVYGERVTIKATHVYNFVLEHGHVALVNGLPCVTLGHGLQAPIAAHPFWGTSAVINVLRAEAGWESGRVVLQEPLRSTATNIE